MSTNVCFSRARQAAAGRFATVAERPEAVVRLNAVYGSLTVEVEDIETIENARKG
jgi:hypothetical protein